MGILRTIVSFLRAFFGSRAALACGDKRQREVAEQLREALLRGDKVTGR